MALCLPSSASFARLRDLYRDNREEIIYLTESRDSRISEKYTFQGTNAFLVLPEEILFDVDVSGTSLFYLIASFLLILSLPPGHNYFFAKFFKLFWVTMEFFFM